MKHVALSARLALAALVIGTLSFREADAAKLISPTEHFHWAADIAENISPENNSYASQPDYVYWPGVDGQSVYANRAMCSHFVNRVLRQAYGLSDAYFTAWFGTTAPQAKDYHDQIELKNRFYNLTSVKQIMPGDLLAIKYPEGSTATGHVMVAVEAAVARTATAPLIPGTVQYAVRVADSSASGHGADDTRRQADGTWDDGAGEGTFRIYATSTGTIVGYTWSTYSNSEYYTQTQRHLVIGRLKPF